MEKSKARGLPFEPRVTNLGRYLTLTGNAMLSACARCRPLASASISAHSSYSSYLEPIETTSHPPTSSEKEHLAHKDSQS